MLAFVIPVRHPRDSPEWPLEMEYLRKTARSIAMQTSAMWQAVVIANHEASLPGYFMVVDDDDLVSNRLAEFVAANHGAHGWYFHDRYLWKDGSRLVYRYSRFSRLCGTSHIIGADLYGLPTDVR
jgi:exopolysaccharide biosynthesis galactosyltransferase PssJ